MANKAVILFGSIPIKKDGRWQTAGFEGDFMPGTAGGRLRVLAGYYLYKTHNIPIVVLSGRRKEKKFIKTPLIAPTIKRELIRLGVPSKYVLAGDRSTDTYSNLINLIEIVKKEGFDEIIILSNEYHLPRIGAMIKYSPGLSELADISKIIYCSAESVLIKENGSLWRPMIRKGYSSPAMKKTLSEERRGIKDIRYGRYKYQPDK